jgi:hypothetical protein
VVAQGAERLIEAVDVGGRGRHGRNLAQVRPAAKGPDAPACTSPHLTAGGAAADTGRRNLGVHILKHLIAAGAAALSLAACAAQAATVLTFDELADGYYAQSVVSQGFQFDDFGSHSSIALFTWYAGAPYDADGPGRTLNNNFTHAVVTMTKVGGGTFDFNSVDLTDIYNSAEAPMGGDVLFSFFDGTSTTTQTVTLDALPGLQTFTFNRTSLVSLTFQAVTLGEVQTDNFVLNAGGVVIEPGGGGGGVPEPATWALMLTGFGLMGGALRHRRAQAMLA